MTDDTPKRGRKPSPVTAAIRNFERAAAKVKQLDVKAQRFHEKYKETLGDFENAKAELDVARKELESVLGQ